MSWWPWSRPEPEPFGLKLGGFYWTIDRQRIVQIQQKRDDGWFVGVDHYGRRETYNPEGVALNAGPRWHGNLEKEVY